eukprot:scaffold122684_cov42-Phaeocystis_antarctica.AAC.1
MGRHPPRGGRRCTLRGHYPPGSGSGLESGSRLGVAYQAHHTSVAARGKDPSLGRLGSRDQSAIEGDWLGLGLGLGPVVGGRVRARARVRVRARVRARVRVRVRVRARVRV